MAKEPSKSLKKTKPVPPMSSSGEGKVPTKGDAQVAQESGSRNAPIINIGIERQDRAAIAEGLSRVLADTYTLYLTTHNFHWNVTGPHFNSLHAMFMDQYTELWGATDVIAERIRALGHYAPGSYAEFSKIATVPDVPQTPPKAMEMVRILVKGHETVSRISREFIPVAEEASDAPTADMLTARCTVHDQTAWMLRSLLED
ncbi:Dps family protein [Variovorax sp. RHLX14]|uniref:Dps family protein n=1 Tax=Variovorax sp. RHLX14 TaxID=1259731 RepID=UPI003F453FBF